MPSPKLLIQAVCTYLACCAFGTGCSTETYLNQTASRGGAVAGSTGAIQIAFINNTPYRAIYTYGSYNNTDPSARPVASQFVATAAEPTLEGESTAEMVPLPCDRVFAIGDPEMLQLINDNLDTSAFNEEALVEGIAFSSAALGDDNDGIATEGFAPPVRALLGVDFPCGSILVIRFEVDDAGQAPFRADFEIIPPKDPGNTR